MALRAIVPIVLLVSAVRPSAGLIAVALVAPVAHVLVTTVFNAYPFELAEATMLAFLAGYLWATRRSLVGEERGVDPLALPAAVFCLVVIAACAEHFRVLQLWRNYPLDYTQETLRLLWTSYLTEYPDPRPWLDGRGFLHVPVLLLGGIALFRCTRALCNAQPALSRWLAVALTVSGAAVALLLLPGPLQYAQEHHVDIWTALGASRWSSLALPSVNAAGAFFLLTGFAAAAVAVEARWLRMPAMLAALAALGALWLTQTRSAIVAGLAVVTSIAVWSFGRRATGLSARQLAALAGGTAVVVGLFIVFVNPFNVLAEGSSQSLLFRVRFAQTGFRIFASAPWTGVGPGQYQSLYPFFATPETLALDPRANNAHNYLLWMAAELGLVGLVSFVWLLTTAVIEAARRLRASPDRFRQVLAAGLAAFMITWSIGQPMELPTVAIPFWILGGIAVSGPGLVRMRWAQVWLPPTRARAALAAIAVLLAITLPARATRAATDVDLARVRYGFHQEGDAGRPFRWAGPRVRFFQRSTVPAVRVGVAALHPGTPQGARLLVRIDGRPQQPIVLPPGEWKDVQLTPSRDAWRGSRYWQVDLDIEPIGQGWPYADRRVAISGIVAVPAWETRDTGSLPPGP